MSLSDLVNKSFQQVFSTDAKMQMSAKTHNCHLFCPWARNKENQIWRISPHISTQPGPWRSCTCNVSIRHHVFEESKVEASRLQWNGQGRRAGTTDSRRNFNGEGNYEPTSNVLSDSFPPTRHSTASELFCPETQIRRASTTKHSEILWSSMHVLSPHTTDTHFDVVFGDSF